MRGRQPQHNGPVASGCSPEAGGKVYGSLADPAVYPEREMLGLILLVALIPAPSRANMLWGSLWQVCTGSSRSCPKLDLWDVLRAVA